MSSAAETGFMSIFVILVVLRIFTVRPVIFDICEIAATHFKKFISCDTHE